MSASIEDTTMGEGDANSGADNIAMVENENSSCNAPSIAEQGTSVTHQAMGTALTAPEYNSMVVEAPNGSAGAMLSGSDIVAAAQVNVRVASVQSHSQVFGGAKVSKKSWHAAEADAFAEARLSMVNHIVDLLKQRRPNATDDWTDKLPQMAKRLEDALYHSANSADEYKERSTLKTRLQQLAQAFPGRKPTAQTTQAQAGKSSSANGAVVGQSSSSSAQGTGKPSEADKDAEHRKQVLKQQQQRLLLLRHASKCIFEPGTCTVTNHCADMKHLWKHIMTCKDQQCETAHCVSSRYVLSHYSKCVDDVCPVCGPVRSAIQKNFVKTKEVNTTMRQGFSSAQMRQMTQNQYSYQQQLKRMRGNDGLVQAIAEPRTQSYPLDPVSCPLYCFTQEQVDAHYKNIHEGMKMTASKVRDICMPVLDDLLRQKYADSVFGAPVDPTAMGLSDYTDIIKAPMDLGSIRKRLDLNYYRDLNHFKADVNLTFDNAILYNPKTNDISTLARDLKKLFSESFKKTITNIEMEAEYHRNTQRNCGFCGDYDSYTKFEPPVYYCNGTCGQRIRRNANYYHTNRNDFHYCSPCFGELKDGQPIKLSEYTIYKRDIIGNKTKLIEAEEPWVQCDNCDRWVHQVCALFNSRRNIEELTYICPLCLTDKKRKNPEAKLITSEKKKMAAHELPHSTLSLFLERRLNERLEKAYVETAEKLHMSVGEVEKCPPLVLRQVAALDKAHTTRELMLTRYKDKGYPAEFPVKTKCLLLFQNIDGQDILLFAMYVYEYGHKCPAPNQRRIYISYLDSVHYLRPRQYRTQIYQEIIISYLDYVKRRGFHTVHIWACPPMKGDDYIFHIHPADQKTPKEDKLRKWYADLLVEAKDRGIVTEISDLYTEYFSDPKKDATSIPYFEGDYCASEAEVIIKDLKDGKLTMDVPIADEVVEAEVEGDDPNKAKRPKGRARRGARPAGIKLTDKSTERDPIMSKLASIIEPMKEAFFVARLHPKEYADACRERRAREVIEEVKHEAEDREKKEKMKEEALTGEALKMEVPQQAVKNEIDAGAEAQAQADEDDFAKSAASIGSTSSKMDAETAQPEEKAPLKEEKDEPATPKNAKSTPKSDGGSGLRRSSSRGSAKPKVKDEEEEPDDKEGEVSPKKGGGSKKRPAAELEEETGAEDSEVKVKSEKAEDDVKMEVSDVKGEKSEAAEDDAKALSAGGATAATAATVVTAATAKSETELAPVGVATGLDEHGIPVCFANLKDDTEDVDDVQESEHFDNRLSFLTLCTGNHYQFDQLRRAKHSSVMVLYHLHNPDAPKFVPSCAVCHKEIISGYRHHCSTCELDYCQRCVTIHGPRVHPPHALRPIAVAGGAPVQLTEEQRKERARALQIHLELVVHAAECTSQTTCTKNCEKMKEYYRHEVTCTIRMSRGCRSCTRINGLLNLHSRGCKKDVCAVPKCREIKEQTRKLTLRQNQMDDRRRAMMNDMYSRAATAGMSGGLAEQDVVIEEGV